MVPAFIMPATASIISSVTMHLIPNHHCAKNLPAQLILMAIQIPAAKWLAPFDAQLAKGRYPPHFFAR